MLHLPRGRREVRLAQLVRTLRIPVALDDSQAVDVAAPAGAAALDVIGTRDLSVAQRAADAALYDGKHSGRAVLATKEHAKVPSLTGDARPAGHGDAGASRMSIATRPEGDWRTDPASPLPAGPPGRLDQPPRN
ncbi:hypothetical protein [Streptomyces sp. NPDC023838]|uniref:hypothetical protein n=1 Tax=Streptomyces sp. NPDC023838 TaxID=3154325 RepID=UPI0033EC90D5